MSDSENPYAYYETQDVRRPGMINFSSSAESGEGTDYEPRVPIVIPLKYGFNGTATLEAAEECVITFDSPRDPITISRDNAAEQIRFKSYRMIVRDETGRSFSFRYKRDSFQELNRARLETWSKQRWHDAAEESYMSVLSLMKKHIMRPVFINMVVLTVLQTLRILFNCLSLVLFFSGQHCNPLSAVVLILETAILAILTFIAFVLSLALWRRQTWALYVGFVCSLLPSFLILLGFIVILLNENHQFEPIVVALLIVIIAFGVTISFLRAMIRYHRQQKRLEKENRK